MQLGPPSRIPLLRSRLSAAACLLFATASTASARADGEAWQIDCSGLFYGEKGRANVVEPIARITRLFAGGQSLSAQLALDAITGASPSGAIPSGGLQTTTTPSGNVQTSSGAEVPTVAFKDTRGALDLEWLKPLGTSLTSTAGAHASREKDYQSLGGNLKLSVDLMHRLTTVSVGGGYNEDKVFPAGGIPAGLSDSSVPRASGSSPKDVTSGLVGVSRILTRRWLVGVNTSRTQERGYLTEPYKVLSVVTADSGKSVGQLSESRPSTRDRMDVLASSVFHFTEHILYSSYRYYWDDWGVRSHTIDLKYRRKLAEQRYVVPHLRFYSQSRADFFTVSLLQGAPLPAFATSDYRLGLLKSMTLGLTYGFQIPNSPGLWNIRGEYMRQWGPGGSGGEEDSEEGGGGAPRPPDYFPPLNIGSLVIGYSVAF